MNFKFSLFKSTLPLQFTIWVNLFIEGITSIDYLNCFYYIDTYLPEFTSENLEKVIAVAIERQEEAEGIKAVSYDEQNEKYKSDALNYDDLMEQIKEVGTQLAEEDKLEDLQEVVEKHLGVGKKVTECKKSQVQIMSLILDDLKELLSE